MTLLQSLRAAGAFNSKISAIWVGIIEKILTANPLYGGSRDDSGWGKTQVKHLFAHECICDLDFTH